MTVSGVGVILGAGVYALVGPASARAGSALWLSFLIAALAAGLTAYSYGRLAQRRPKDSPEFQYTALAFGPRVGFVAGWLMLVADLLAAAAAALGFGGYLAHLAGTPVALNALLAPRRSRARPARRGSPSRSGWPSSSPWWRRPPSSS